MCDLWAISNSTKRLQWGSLEDSGWTCKRLYDIIIQSTSPWEGSKASFVGLNSCRKSGGT